MNITQQVPVTENDICFVKNDVLAEDINLSSPMYTRSIAAIVKPTHDCNLSCVYCYDRVNSKDLLRMSDSVLQTLIARLTKFHKPKSKIKIIWHGGEPLIMGIDFYRRVVEMQNDYGNEFEFINGIQTNGYLLDNEFIGFFLENNFQLGLSIDGPEYIHDQQRPIKSNNKGSFKKVYDNLLTLKKYNQSMKFGGVISVVTNESVKHLIDIYRFFNDLEIDFQLNPIYLSGSNNGMSFSGFDFKQYLEEMTSLFDHWIETKNSRVIIDPFAKIIVNLFTLNPIGCQFAGLCHHKFLSITHSGDIYPCGRFASCDEVKLGNIIEDEISDVVTSPKYLSITNARKLAMTKCGNCRYFTICNAGCVHNSFMGKQDFSEKDYYCSTNYLLFKHIEKKLYETLGFNESDTKCIHNHQIQPLSKLSISNLCHEHTIIKVLNHYGLLKITNDGMNQTIFEFANRQGKSFGNWNDHHDHLYDDCHYHDHKDYSDHFDWRQYGDHVYSKPYDIQ